MKLLVKIQKFDKNSTLWVRKNKNITLGRLLSFITYTGESYTWVGVAFIFWALLQFNLSIIPQQHLFIQSMTVGVFSMLVGKVFKVSFKRRRPNAVFTEFTTGVATPKDHSFPSNHAATSVSLFVVLLLTRHPTAPIVGIWAMLVSFSRFYLGVHFVSDVIGGLVLGALTGIGFYFSRLFLHF